MKKILITGSLGLVGSACVDFFREKDWHVIGIDNNMRAELFGVEVSSDDHIGIDIRHEQAINTLFAAHKFDAIIHAAAQPSHDWAKNDPIKDFDINARGTLILLEATRKYCPEAVFVYVSSDKVYGENMIVGGKSVIGKIHDKIKVIDFTLEEDKTRFNSTLKEWKGFDESLGLDFAGQRSLFGCSKTAADLYVQEYGNYFGMKTACFRPGCITGKNHKGAEYHGFLAYLAKCIREGKTYKIFGFKGKQVRDQIHANDLASVFWHFIENPKVGAVYNIGGGQERSVSVLEAAEMISKEMGKTALLEQHERRQGDRQWDVHDVLKFRRDYPEWDYTYSLDDIIKDLCKN